MFGVTKQNNRPVYNKPDPLVGRSCSERHSVEGFFRVLFDLDGQFFSKDSNNN